MRPGDILFHRDFEFADGAAADKYLVILGGGDAHVIAVKTTSNGTRYRSDHGCQAGNRYPAFLLTQGCCCLPLNTWVCLGDFYELSVAQVNGGVVAGDVRRYGKLSAELTRCYAIRAACCVSLRSMS